ncbi:MAG: ABC transporter permease [Clostridia bacterium]|nr:ABC transporter permease [Clostridia bacterium]
MFDKYSLKKDDFGKLPQENEPETNEAEINEDELFGFAEFDEKKSEVIAAPRYSYWKSVWKTFISSKFTVAVAIFVVLVVSFSFIYPAFSDYDPMVAPHINDVDWKYLAPSWQHIFGTDNIGNEVFDVVWEGARNSLIVSLTATAINMIVGIVIGAIWGFSKKMDKWMIEIYNIISNIPFLLLAMILAYVLRNKFSHLGEFGAFIPLIITMTITDWIFVAYFIRTQVMIIRDREYNLASKCLGTSTWTMITKNILPYLVSVIMTYISRQVPALISYEVFLSYMGLGLGQQYASLGRTISQYTTYMNGYPHLFWIPVSILAIISISLYIVGQKLADAADPRTHR